MTCACGSPCAGRKCSRCRLLEQQEDDLEWQQERLDAELDDMEVNQHHELGEAPKSDVEHEDDQEADDE